MSSNKIDKIKSFLTKHIWIIPISVAFLNRIIGITRSSIWHDEGYTMWIIRNNPIEILSRASLDVHPPAYYLTAKIWVSIFGDSVLAIRSLSLVFSLATIFLVYKIIESIWSRKAAFWTSMIIALSPFLLRLTQEARMYSMVAFFIALATYFFIKYLKDKKTSQIVLFVISMSVAIYTQYYAFFAIISLWLIMAIFTPGILKFKWISLIKKSIGIFDYRWWLANIALIAVYLPWFPVAISQVTRVGGGYWIRPEWMTARTVPNSVLQFATYGHLDALYYWTFGNIFYWAIVLVAIFSGVILYKYKDKRKVISSLIVFAYLPMLLVFAYSKLKTPIYQDRYFIFAALAIFAIWGCLIASVKHKLIKVAVVIIVFSVLITGCFIERNSENHKMRQIATSLNSLRQDNDMLISGSLYTFLDSSYYFGYGKIKYLSNGVGSHGETSLFYDQQDDYLIKPSQIDSSTKRVWIISKSGENYIDKLNSGGWKEQSSIKDGSLQAILYIRN